MRRAAAEWRRRPDWRAICTKARCTAAWMMDLHGGSQSEELRLRLRPRTGSSARLRHRLGRLGHWARSLGTVGPTGPASESPHCSHTQWRGGRIIGLAALSDVAATRASSSRGLPAAGRLGATRMSTWCEIGAPHWPWAVALCGHVAWVIGHGYRLGGVSGQRHFGNGGRPVWARLLDSVPLLGVVAPGPRRSSCVGTSMDRRMCGRGRRAGCRLGHGNGQRHSGSGGRPVWARFKARSRGWE
jgi:hypothetical protein